VKADNMTTKTRIRNLTESEVQFKLIVEQDDTPVRGNAMATDEPELDREAEDEILRRLDSGDVWAWAHVRVIASWRGFEGSDSLGGCSYADEEDFKKGGYYDDMKAEALHALNFEIRGTAGIILHELAFDPRNKISDKPRKGFELHAESKHYVRKGYTLVKCNGEAHSNAYIDHCMVCLGDRWGWTVEKLPSK
jgi:hypothetical protein